MLAMPNMPRGLSQCAQEITMASYSVCLPAGWRVERNNAADQIVVCDTKKRCATAWGAAPKGLAFLFVRPAEGVYEHAHYSGPREIVEAAPHAGLPAPDIVQVEMAQGGSGLNRRCFVARRLVPAVGVWDEEYGLEVSKHLFWAWAHYEDDPKRTEQYRVAIREILSSISPR
jgi:hypothetical protein